MIAAAAVLRAVAHALQSTADGLLWGADLLTTGARPVLRLSRLCMERAREWDPRLWDRDHDPRSDTRDRRP
ncbi:hypothetical protein [Methylobacterium sp. SI9]|uniref:hypothetical protein n=1 Tax=Methylobacterium guangdongense TaxID=3138811 RepID=UPI00313C921C